MTVAFNAMHDAHLGYAAIFLCVGAGFICLKRVSGIGAGPTFWAAGSFCNALGFLLWSGAVPIPSGAYYLLGELSHVAGFFLLAAGAIRFADVEIPRRMAVSFCALWAAAWAVGALLLRTEPFAAGVILKSLRALLFAAAGSMLLGRRSAQEPAGQRVAGLSLMLWAAFLVLSIFARINNFVFFGLLIGFHVLASFSMATMVVDRMRLRSETIERHARKLEGILPICSYCKKIRDEKNEWRELELYIEDRSKAEFSHGICPECFDKHRPDR